MMLEKMIKNHGEIEGRKRFDLWRKNMSIAKTGNSDNISLKSFIKRYGEDGVDKYNEFVSKVSVKGKGNEEWYIRKYGQEEGSRRYKEKILKLKGKNGADCSLKNFIRLYGEEEGNERYNKWLGKGVKTRKDRKCGTIEYYINKFGEEEGTIKYNEYISKVVRTKENFIKENGEEEGTKKFNEFVNKSKQTLEKYILKYGEEDGPIKYNEYIKSKVKNSIFCLDYWVIKNNYDMELAIKEYAKFQIRDLDWFIRKYGEEEGKCKYDKRCNKVREWTLNRPHINPSKISQSLFSSIENFLNLENCFYAIKNLEKRVENFKVDFIHENKIIEFYGDYYHCNPKKYKEDFFNKKVGKTAKEIWDDDFKRIGFIKDKGFDLLIVWEDDFMTKPNQVFNDCINFIQGV